MTSIPNLLIVAGTGAKSGKTTMACRIIEQLRDKKPVAVRISPHFHTSSPGLVIIDEGSGYAVYEETNAGTTKDTARMLKAGAAKVFLILAWDSDLEKVFKKAIAVIPEDTPVVCESHGLRDYIEPGLFVLMSAEKNDERQDLSHLIVFPHLKFRLEELSVETVPIGFENGKWKPAEFIRGFKNKD